MYSIVYTKKAIKDINFLKSAKLDNKAKLLIELIKNSPFQTPPPYEKLIGDLSGCYSRRINIKHRLIYEKHHGKLPKGYKVIFADGNKNNFDIDNLVAISNSQELILNRRNLIFEEQELTKSGVLIAKVIDTANKRKKEGV